jgi:hypothetical protein
MRSLFWVVEVLVPNLFSNVLNGRVDQNRPRVGHFFWFFSCEVPYAGFSAVSAALPNTTSARESGITPDEWSSVL